MKIMDQNFILVLALRYSLEHQSHMVDDLVEVLINNWRLFPFWEQDSIKSIINKAIRQDKQKWKKILIL